MVPGGDLAPDAASCSFRGTSERAVAAEEEEEEFGEVGKDNDECWRAVWGETGGAVGKIDAAVGDSALTSTRAGMAE